MSAFISASSRRHLWTIPLALLVAGLLAVAAQAAPPGAPSPGAPGIGDQLFPTLGNGGYDALHYDLALRYPTATPAQPVDGVVTMLARATQSLSRFNLDYAGDTVNAVTVGGAPATFSRIGEELVITPSRPIRRHKRFVTRVSFCGHTYEPAVDDPFPFGWFSTATGSVTAGQPDRGDDIYPVNDTPADKATYSFRLNVPSSVRTAVANGRFLGKRSQGDRTVWSYSERHPMASELIQVAVGDFEVVNRGSTAGVPLRDVVESTQAARDEDALSRTPAQMGWMVDNVGRYPFENYGILSADRLFFYALESQTLSLFPSWLFTPEDLGLELEHPEQFYEPIMVHELAHMWYGDSVAPKYWTDVWLNEGHATWYEWEYTEEKGWVDVFSGRNFEQRIRQTYAIEDQLRADFGPPGAPKSAEDVFDLFNQNVYDGGALVLYALRQVIGDPAFRGLERRWAQQYRDESVTTEDFIVLASKVAHRDMSGFLKDWLYSPTTPRMPGHPDWTVDPVQTGPPAATRMREQRGERFSTRMLESGQLR